MERTKHGETMFSETFSILFECQFNNFGESLVNPWCPGAFVAEKEFSEQTQCLI
jgi:hypothetical protein